MRAGYSHNFTPAQKKSFADTITGQVEQLKARHHTLVNSKSCIMMSKIFLAFLLIAGVNSAVLQEGENCGVDGGDFLLENFTGNVVVAGKGCASGNNTNCLCAPNFDDQQSLSEFLWQCNNAVEFGPKNGKVCPPTPPVLRKVGVNSVDFSVDMLGVTVPCNTSVNPTGRPGDETCGYSECETGGSFSAICGCVDLDDRNETESVGMQWICLHSTCGCSLTEDYPTSTTSASRSTPFILAALAASVAFVVAGL